MRWRALLPVLCGLACADAFIPMSPVGAETVPVEVEVEGDRGLARDCREQLVGDIDFSGLLSAAAEGEGWASVSVTVGSTPEGVTLSARVSAGGEQLTARTYTGSSVYALAHALADDLVYDLTGEEGIASTRLAYVTRTPSGYALSVKSLDPRSAWDVMVDGDVITTPAWSPLGDRIVFTSYRSGNADLWSYSFGTTSAEMVFSSPGLNTSPAWAPDGGSLALTLTGSGSADIYLLELDGGEATRLTLRGSIETSPTFSPTGAQIAFTSDRVGYPQLYVMDASGGTAMRISRTHGYCDSPAWSPDGDRIAYTARVGGDFHVFVMDADGTDIRQVTTEGTLNEDPVWGPTGRHLAFSSDRDGERAIYMVELNGLTVRRVSDGGECYCPTWSPLGFI